MIYSMTVRFLMILVFLISGLSAQEGKRVGKIQSKLTSGGYSYLRVMEADSVYWIAVTEMSVAAGDEIEFVSQMWMADFFSKTLKMTFPKILFAGNAKIINKDRVADESAAQITIPANPEYIGIKTLLRDLKSFENSQVAIKGEVIKVNSNIMGKTWVHIKDAEDDSSRIVVTTNTEDVKMGSKISVFGTLSVDKDFGMGYFYACIIENAFIQE